jgi:beta-phosphoglucomutase-like phosphatase (HAD superfamily)
MQPLTDTGMEVPIVSRLVIFLDDGGVMNDNSQRRLYGPDLIDTFKEGPEYYERIFAELGISSTNAVVVDDSPRAINWAAQVGARTVLVSNSPPSETGTTAHIRSLEELPAIIHRLD